MSVFSPYIDDKVYIVTGGAVGVGAAVVRTLLAENARYVVFLDTKEREGSTLESELYRNFGALRSKFIECDISSESDLSSAFLQVLNRYRRVDGIINNAAVLAEDQEYERMIDVNFKATVNTTLKALDIMHADKRGAGGTIINISSVLALQQNCHLPVYAATKTAVMKFTNSIGAAECFSKTKVRVMTVCLGPTDTAILQRQNAENFEKDLEHCLTSEVPVRQRVESAATGIVEVIKRGASGSTWIVANDSPAIDVTDTVKKGFKVLSGVVPVFDIV